MSCPGLPCLTTRSICGIETAPISVRLALRGETPPEATARKGCVFVCLCPVGCGSPFSPGSGVLDPLRSRTLLLIKPRPGGQLLAIQLPPATVPITQPTITNRSRHLSDVSSSSEHAGLSHPRLGSFCLPPPTCQRVLQLLVPRYMTACLTSSNEACRPLERVTSTWDSWLFAA